jgi:rsbT co-antagonist protein RsbR
MRFNPACEHATGYAANEVIGKRVWDMLVPANEIDAVQSVFGELSTEMCANSYEGLWITRDKEELLVKWTHTALPGDDGNIAFVISAGIDVTALRQGELERLQLKEQVIDAQKAAIRELSTPLIPLSDNLIVMPLVGTLDSARAQQVMETLLQGVQNTDAEFVILDITGVSVVDTQVANVLIQAANAVRLLGAQVIITGIRPDVAQTLVYLGTNLRGIITRSTLQRGIAYAAGKR